MSVKYNIMMNVISVGCLECQKLVTKVRLCIVVLPIELDLLIPLSVTLAVFQGHSSVKQFQLKSFCFYMIKFKFCMIVNHIA